MKKSSCRERLRRAKEYFYEHWSFLLTISLTYILGFMFVGMSYLRDVNSCVLVNDEYVFNMLLGSIIPTTVTYVLTSILVNMYDIFASSPQKGLYVVNLTTLGMLLVYMVTYSLYMMSNFSWVWVWIEAVFTLVLLVLNFYSYREKYFANHRRHGLT